VGQRLSEKRDTFVCYNYLVMSNLVNHKVIRSNYMRIDIELLTVAGKNDLQQGFSRFLRRIAVKWMKVIGQFADKWHMFTYVALIATTSHDVAVRIEFTAVCKVRNASHTRCLKNHANIVKKYTEQTHALMAST